jgi:FixJ family two-component response regulator
MNYIVESNSGLSCTSGNNEMSTLSPTVFMVDDDPSVLRATQRLLTASGFNVDTFESADAFLQKYAATTPGCLVLDVAMPGFDGLELQQALVARGSALPIIFLTGQADVPMSVRAMKRGALDFLTKPVDEADLVGAIRKAIERDCASRKHAMEIGAIDRRIATLTPREEEVLAHLVTGRLNKQIAAELGTVEKTIKVHRARVMQKMHVRSIAELVVLVERSRMRSSV